MRSSLSVAALFGFLLGSGADAATQEYRGLCEASAAASLDERHFAVASDETNTILVYERGVVAPVSDFDAEDFTTFDKSDIEGAARIGSRVYWISSHSFNSSGKDRQKRRVFFATDIVAGTGRPTLRAAGKPAFGLRDPLAAAADASKSDLNVEGLAAANGEGLLVGLRSPLHDGRATVVPFENPAGVVEHAEAPRFRSAIRLDLEDLGIRSLDRVGTGARAYLIVAGPVEDGGKAFRLFWWSGRPDDLKPEPATGMPLNADLTPEALVIFPDEGRVHVLSDDGNRCSDEGPVGARKFRGVELALPAETPAK